MHVGAAALLAAAILLAGCRQEPDFDERFEKAEAVIRAKAAAIDRDLAAAERQTRAGVAAPAPAASSAAPAGETSGEPAIRASPGTR